MSINPEGEPKSSEKESDLIPDVIPDEKKPNEPIEPEPIQEEPEEPEPTEEQLNARYDQMKKFLGIDKMELMVDELNKTQNAILTDLGNSNQTLKRIDDLIKQAQENYQPQQQAGQEQPTATSQQQPGLPQNTNPGLDLEKLQAIGAIAKDAAQAYAAARGNIQNQGQMQNDLVQTIMGAFGKLIQIHVDDAVFRTYDDRGRSVPSWIKPETSQKSVVKVE